VTSLLENVTERASRRPDTDGFQKSPVCVGGSVLPREQRKHDKGDFEMRNLMIAAGAAALLGASSLAALAAEASGAIASVDTSAGTITLDSGQTFVLPPSVDVAALQVGKTVMITYDEAGGQMMASEITPAM
jgi:hypothetical protein